MGRTEPGAKPWKGRRGEEEGEKKKKTPTSLGTVHGPENQPPFFQLAGSHFQANCGARPQPGFSHIIASCYASLSSLDPGQNLAFCFSHAPGPCSC